MIALTFDTTLTTSKFRAFFYRNCFENFATEKRSGSRKSETISRWVKICALLPTKNRTCEQSNNCSLYNSWDHLPSYGCNVFWWIPSKKRSCDNLFTLFKRAIYRDSVNVILAGLVSPSTFFFVIAVLCWDPESCHMSSAVSHIRCKLRHLRSSGLKLLLKHHGSESRTDLIFLFPADDAASVSKRSNQSPSSLKKHGVSNLEYGIPFRVDLLR